MPLHDERDLIVRIWETALKQPPECSQERWLDALRKVTNRKIAEVRPKGGIEQSDLMWAVLGETDEFLHENGNMLIEARPTAKDYKERFARLTGFISVATFETITGGTYQTADDFVNALLNAATGKSDSISSPGGQNSFPPLPPTSGGLFSSPSPAAPALTSAMPSSAVPKPSSQPLPQPQALKPAKWKGLLDLRSAGNITKAPAAAPEPKLLPQSQPQPQTQVEVKAQFQSQGPQPAEPKGLYGLRSMGNIPKAPVSCQDYEVRLPHDIKATDWVAPYQARLGRLLGVRIALPTGQAFHNSVMINPYKARIDRDTDEDIVHLESELKRRIAYAVFTRWVADMYNTGAAQDLAVFVQNDLAGMATDALNLNDRAVATISRLSQATRSIQPPTLDPRSSHFYTLKTNSVAKKENQGQTQASIPGSYYDLVAHLEHGNSATTRKRTFGDREKMQQTPVDASRYLIARPERERRVFNIWKIATNGKDLARYTPFLRTWQLRFDELAGQVLQRKISVSLFVDKMKDTFVMPYVEVAYFGNDYDDLVPIVQSLITHTLSEVPKDEDEGVQTGIQANKRRRTYADQNPATANAQ